MDMPNQILETIIGRAAGNLMDSIALFRRELKKSLESKAQRVEINVYNQAIDTGEVIDGRKVMIVRFNFGSLPNATTKSLMVPSNIKSLWGKDNEHWLDVSNSHVYRTTDGMHYTLPGVASVDINYEGQVQAGNRWWDTVSYYTIGSDQISIFMTNDEIFIETQTNKLDCIAVVAVRFLGEFV